MKRSNVQQASLCNKVLRHINYEPQFASSIALSMGSTESRIQYALERLVRSGLIEHVYHKGYYRFYDKKITYFDILRAIQKLKDKEPVMTKPEELGPEIEVDPKTTRKCRSCQDFLPASRYFKCYKCEPELGLVDDDFIYEEPWSSGDDEIWIGYPLDTERFTDNYNKESDKTDGDE